MPQKCTICSHPDRTVIDIALVGGVVSNRAIADQFSVSISAVGRHAANHLPGELLLGNQAQRLANAATVVEGVAEAYAIARTLLHQSLIAGDTETALAAHKAYLKVLELLARMHKLLPVGSVQIMNIVRPTAPAADLFKELEHEPEMKEPIREARQLITAVGGDVRRIPADHLIGSPAVQALVDRTWEAIIEAQEAAETP